VRLRAKYVLAGELEVVEDGVVEVDDAGVVVGVGRYTGGLRRISATWC
jgi:DNA-directed RNA polymerase subunit E'/Rpb7